MRKWVCFSLIMVIWVYGILAIHATAQDEAKQPPPDVAQENKEGDSKAGETAEPAPSQPDTDDKATAAKEDADADANAEPPTNAELASQLIDLRSQMTSSSYPKMALDTIWTLIAGFLVFFMNVGFGCVEAGFCRSKNTVNILGKNFVVFGISSLAFWLFGFGLMFGNGNDYFGTSGFLSIGSAAQYSSLDWTSIPITAKFFFQLAFAATAATIISGCVAERIHYRSYMIFVIFIVGVSYPVTGHWIWGGGWLQNLGMWDFAGSTVVHSVGGWAGLAGILLLGPRLGKYQPDGSVKPIRGHSMALAFLGGLILWLGWFGFNPGSFMAADADGVARVVVTTNMAAAAGLVAATLTAWIVLGTPDFSMTINGALAGLVAVTAPCAFVSTPCAVIIGLVAGILVVFSVLFFDKLKIDDPVGALSVHLTNGIWGTLAVGLFASKDIYSDLGSSGLFLGGGMTLLTNQIIGVLAVGGFTFFSSLAVWYVIKMVCGLRVDQEAETIGLDRSEMGMEAYPESQSIATS